jgi:prevent-host-death family protein
MSSYSVADAKNSLGSLIDKTLAGEEVIITRHGKRMVELRVVDAPSKRPAGRLMLRTPDAFHAAICSGLGMTLITLAPRLAAAGQALGIAVIIPTP